MEKHPQELRWEAQRLLFEAKSATDEAQRKLMLALALKLPNAIPIEEGALCLIDETHSISDLDTFVEDGPFDSTFFSNARSRCISIA